MDLGFTPFAFYVNSTWPCLSHSQGATCLSYAWSVKYLSVVHILYKYKNFATKETERFLKSHSQVSIKYLIFLCKIIFGVRHTYVPILVA